jgi:hypothetical protein
VQLPTLLRRRPSAPGFPWQIARGFSLYIARLALTADDRFLISGSVDLMAPAIVLVVTAVLSMGVRESGITISSEAGVVHACPPATLAAF